MKSRKYRVSHVILINQLYVPLVAMFFSAMGESPRDGMAALCVPLFVCWVSVYVRVCAH